MSSSWSQRHHYTNGFEIEEHTTELTPYLAVRTEKLERHFGETRAVNGVGRFHETRDGKTLLTLLDRGYPSEEQRDSHEIGWPAFLDSFERTLARARSRN